MARLEKAPSLLHGKLAKLSIEMAIRLRDRRGPTQPAECIGDQQMNEVTGDETGIRIALRSIHVAVLSAGDLAR